MRMSAAVTDALYWATGRTAEGHLLRWSCMCLRSFIVWHVMEWDSTTLPTDVQPQLEVSMRKGLPLSFKMLPVHPHSLFKGGGGATCGFSGYAFCAHDRNVAGSDQTPAAVGLLSKALNPQLQGCCPLAAPAL